MVGRLLKDNLFKKYMSKIKKMESEEEEEYLPLEVVSVEDMTEMIIRNACISIDLLHEMSFCNECHGKRA